MNDSASLLRQYPLPALLGLLAIGGLWMLISCFRNGIDIFDLW